MCAFSISLQTAHMLELLGPSPAPLPQDSLLGLLGGDGVGRLGCGDIASACKIVIITRSAIISDSAELACLGGDLGEERWALVLVFFRQHEQLRLFSFICLGYDCANGGSTRFWRVDQLF